MKIEKDSLEGVCKNYLKFQRSSSLKMTRKEKMDRIIKTRQILFGFNLKSDNQDKTKQLKLF